MTQYKKVQCVISCEKQSQSTIISKQIMRKQVQLKEGLQPITIEHIPLIKKLLTDTFLERNEVWKSFAMNRDQLQDFFQRNSLLHLQCQEIARKKFGPSFTTDWMIVKNGKIASSMQHFEVDTYKQVVLKNDKEEKLALFKALQNEGKKLIEGINLNKYAPGTAVYIDFGGANTEFNLTSNDRLYMMSSYYIAMKKYGVRWVIGRSSNIRATKLYENMGGRIVNEITFERDGLQFPLYFIELDMENPKFLKIEKNFHLIQQKYLEQSMKSKAKL